MQVIETDFLVIGSGIAGLATALWAASYGEVVIISKDKAEHCNSTLAQGGIAAAIGQNDSPELHAQDTLKAGAGICQPEIVALLTQAAPEIIKTLVDLGTNFDLAPSGEMDLAKEGAHSLARVLHHGDDTGAEIWQTLYRQVEKMRGISLLPGSAALELLIEQGRCIGAIVHSGEDLVYFLARGVVLATGGCGQIYGRTTNSLRSTGDGLAMAWRAGAELRDLEFIQFHPTALDTSETPFFLISEAVRGAGAVLVTEKGERFMQSYHPMADLAPRDVVSRAIVLEEQKGRRVFLDATSLGPEFPRRFPNIYAKLHSYGIEPARDLIPVTPAAHFTIGGVKTDSFGRTNIPGLYACGEVASTGVHGANRLASNSLLEGLVFARRIALTLAQAKEQTGRASVSANSPQNWQMDSYLADWLTSPPKPLEKKDSRLVQLQDLMWLHVGIIRDGEKLSSASEILDKLAGQIEKDEFELNNMIQVAKLITSAALARLESRGSHFRSDYPQASPAWEYKHVSMRRYSA